jgi:hypothetical protein
VLVDGLWLKLAVPTGDVKSDSLGRQRPVKHKEKRVMLTALGLWDEGHGEMLTWQLAPGEEAGSWGTFLSILYRKGITEETTRLLVSDGPQGLEKALYRHGWEVPHQLLSLAQDQKYRGLLAVYSAGDNGHWDVVSAESPGQTGI